MLQNFLEHLMHLSAETSPGINSWKDLVAMLAGEKTLFQVLKKPEVTRASFICTYYFSNSLFSYAKNCMSSQLSVLEFP